MKAILIAMAVLVAPVMGEEINERKAGEARMASFCGGVLGKSAIITGKNTAVTEDGEFVSFNGKGFAATSGYYGTSGNQTFGGDTLVVKSRNVYYGSTDAWKNGNSYDVESGDSAWITTSPNVK